MRDSLFDVSHGDPAWRNSTAWILQIALALAFAAAGIAKLTGLEPVAAILAPIAAGEDVRLTVGALEVMLAPFFLWPAAARWAGLVGIALMAGAAGILAALGHSLVPPIVMTAALLTLVVLRWPRPSRQPG